MRRIILFWLSAEAKDLATDSQKHYCVLEVSVLFALSFLPMDTYSWNCSCKTFVNLDFVPRQKKSLAKLPSSFRLDRKTMSSLISHLVKNNFHRLAFRYFTVIVDAYLLRNWSLAVAQIFCMKYFFSEFKAFSPLRLTMFTTQESHESIHVVIKCSVPIKLWWRAILYLWPHFFQTKKLTKIWGIF